VEQRRAKRGYADCDLKTDTPSELFSGGGLDWLEEWEKHMNLCFLGVGNILLKPGHIEDGSVWHL